MEKQVIIDQDQVKKKKIEAICKKIMSIVIPAICIMMVLLTVFKGSSEARAVKRVLKSEGCKVRICQGTEVADILEELDLEIANVDEIVVAVDKEDSEIFAFVMFCESRLDAEDAEKILQLHLLYEEDSYRYSVERNAKAVCFGYIDLVEAVMEKLD